MNAKLAFTAISQIPLFGSRAAAISCCREAATNAVYALEPHLNRRRHLASSDRRCGRTQFPAHRATVRFAAELGYEVTVVKDATVAIQSCRNTNREIVDRP
jgi:hypothetical protein